MKKILPTEINENTMKLIGTDWMLVGAEKEGRVNAMTASWGGLGVMWGKNVAFVVIRPQRFTKEFVDNSETFSLSFFNEDKKDMLKYMGAVSGRDEDKIAKSGLTVLKEQNTPYFDEARLTLICKKLFVQPFNKDSFLDKKIIDAWYKENDFHDLYIAEIIDVIEK